MEKWFSQNHFVRIQVEEYVDLLLQNKSGAQGTLIAGC